MTLDDVESRGQTGGRATAVAIANKIGHSSTRLPEVDVASIPVEDPLIQGGPNGHAREGRSRRTDRETSPVHHPSHRCAEYPRVYAQVSRQSCARGCARTSVLALIMATAMAVSYRQIEHLSYQTADILIPKPSVIDASPAGCTIVKLDNPHPSGSVAKTLPGTHIKVNAKTQCGAVVQDLSLTVTMVDASNMHVVARTESKKANSARPHSPRSRAPTSRWMSSQVIRTLERKSWSPARSTPPTRGPRRHRRRGGPGAAGHRSRWRQWTSRY